MQKIPVKTARPYDVIIGRNILADCGGAIKKLTQGNTAAIISDDTVNNLYGEIVEKSLAEAGFRVCRFVFPHGENSKNMTVLGQVLEFLAQEKITRTDFIVALGGGVVGDLAGFAAAVYLRGIDFVQIPTTFLAMIDSSVGGKTAVDLKAGKNLAGAFHQPLEVICDLDTLKTLDEIYFADGIAEAIKYGVIADSNLFSKMADCSFRGDLEHTIKRCVEIKADIVNKDEKETGQRRLLNLGHTIGHGIELLSNMEITHGHAVAIGINIVAQACAAKGICTKATANAIFEAITANNLPYSTNFKGDDLANAAANDKKRRGNTIALILPTAIGECIIEDYNINNLPAFIESGL